MTWYCKDVRRNPPIEQIELGFSTGNDRFTEAYFFIVSFPEVREIKKIIPTEKRYQFTKDKSEMILPYSEAFKAKNSEQTLLNFYRSVLK